MCTHKRSQPWFAACISVICLLLSSSAWSQASYSAQIRGVIKDQNGALVPNATIIITNVATGISATAHTEGVG